MLLPLRDPLPSGWRMCLHPEGSRYFVYDLGDDKVRAHSGQIYVEESLINNPTASSHTRQPQQSKLLENRRGGSELYSQGIS